MSFPSSIRTGLGDGPDPSADKITADSPLGKKLLSLVFVLIKRAAQSAAVYCEHAGRMHVTSEDVKCALKYQAHRFLKDDGFEGLESEAAEMHAFLDAEHLDDDDAMTDAVIDSIDEDDDDDQEEEDEDDQEEEDEDDQEEEEEEDQEEEPLSGTTSPCECIICTAMRTLDWDAWHPEDPAEAFIRECVQKTIEHA